MVTPTYANGRRPVRPLHNKDELHVLVMGQHETLPISGTTEYRVYLSGMSTSSFGHK